jgi:hypothetical protein
MCASLASFDYCSNTPIFLQQSPSPARKGELDDDQAGYICGALLEAGPDTRAAILWGCILALLIFPDV